MRGWNLDAGVWQNPGSKEPAVCVAFRPPGSRGFGARLRSVGSQRCHADKSRAGGGTCEAPALGPVMRLLRPCTQPSLPLATSESGNLGSAHGIGPGRWR